MEDKVYFKSSSAAKICGILSNPSGDKSKLMVVLVHGFNSGKNSSTNLALVERLNKDRVSTFRIDLFAHGDSEGNFEDLTISEAADDVFRAIELLKNMTFTRIGLMGGSFGGLAAVIAASKISDLRFLALKCPVSSYLEFRDYANPGMIDEWKKRGYSYREDKKLKFSFYENAVKNIGYDFAPSIKTPVLIVHGGADTEVPVAQSIRLSKLISGCELKIIPGANHYFKEGNSREEMLNAIVDFIAKYK